MTKAVKWWIIFTAEVPGKDWSCLADLYILCLFFFICLSKQCCTKITSLGHSVTCTSLQFPTESVMHHFAHYDAVSAIIPYWAKSTLAGKAIQEGLMHWEMGNLEWWRWFQVLLLLTDWKHFPSQKEREQNALEILLPDFVVLTGFES